MTNDFISSEIELIPSGIGCGHKGCINHISHPCEICGRIAANGEFKRYKKNQYSVIGRDSILIPLIKL